MKKSPIEVLRRILERWDGVESHEATMHEFSCLMVDVDEYVRYRAATKAEMCPTSRGEAHMKQSDNEWTGAIESWVRTQIPLADLLALVAEATRELCAKFPDFECHNGATNNWRVADKVAEYIKANYP